MVLPSRERVYYGRQRFNHHLYGPIRPDLPFRLTPSLPLSPLIHLGSTLPPPKPSDSTFPYHRTQPKGSPCETLLLRTVTLNDTLQESFLLSLLPLHLGASLLSVRSDTIVVSGDLRVRTSRHDVCRIRYGISTRTITVPSTWGVSDFKWEMPSGYLLTCEGPCVPERVRFGLLSDGVSLRRRPTTLIVAWFSTIQYVCTTSLESLTRVLLLSQTTSVGLFLHLTSRSYVYVDGK